METLTLLSTLIRERIDAIDKLIHKYEYNWYMVGVAYSQDRYDLGALDRLHYEKNFLLDLLKEIKWERNLKKKKENILN